MKKKKKCSNKIIRREISSKQVSVQNKNPWKYKLLIFIIDDNTNNFIYFFHRLQKSISFRIQSRQCIKRKHEYIVNNENISLIADNKKIKKKIVWKLHDDGLLTAFKCVYFVASVAKWLRISVSGY